MKSKRRFALQFPEDDQTASIGIYDSFHHDRNSHQLASHYTRRPESKDKD